jgi:hypothetical protein
MNIGRKQGTERDTETRTSFWRMSALRHEPPLPANGCTRARSLSNQPQFQIGPIGVSVQQGPKLPPL